ncbi:MAG: hypothetical protein KA408_05900 [Flavobacteriales bacterium]|nr:hypothetical protein [Flavobacteriales bacterium]
MKNESSKKRLSEDPKPKKPTSKGEEVPTPGPSKDKEGAEGIEANEEKQEASIPNSVQGDHGAPQPPLNPGPQGIH